MIVKTNLKSSVFLFLLLPVLLFSQVKLPKLVSDGMVDKMVAVRYVGVNNPVGTNLYNTEGLPASPFRTSELY